MTNTPVIGVISPPGWYDPALAEIPNLFSQPVRVQQCPLHLIDFDYEIDSIANTEKELLQAAGTLTEIGCDILAMTGTPFAWAGLKSLTDARERRNRISTASGAPLVMAGISLLEACTALNLKKVGLACTYYSDDWRDRWATYVSASGLDVLAACNLSDCSIAPQHETGDRSFWAPSPTDIEKNVRHLLRTDPSIEIVLISGSGARTLQIIESLEDETGIPVVGADTALYWSIARVLGLEMDGAPLGALKQAR